MCSLLTPTSNVRANLQRGHHQIKLKVKDDEPTVFSLAGTLTADTKEIRVEIVWRNPKQPLTLVIVTPFTKTQETFSLNMDYPPSGSMSNIYQIVDGEEKEMSMNEQFLRMQSDSNYEVVVKLVPTPDKMNEVTFAYIFDRLESVFPQ